ncbi:hypothetical protein D3C81_1734690 [compost metagenome]
MQHERLRGVSAAGYGGADDPQRFLFQCGQQSLILCRIGDKSDTEPPNIFFLRRTVHLNRQNARMQAGQLAE